MAVEGFMALVNTIADTPNLPPSYIKEVISMVSNQDSLLRQTGLRGVEVLGQKILQPLPTVMAPLLVACNDTISENSILANRSVYHTPYAVSTVVHAPLLLICTCLWLYKNIGRYLGGRGRRGGREGRESIIKQQW